MLYDTTAPVITVNGDNPATVELVEHILMLVQQHTDAFMRVTLLLQGNSRYR